MIRALAEGMANRAAVDEAMVTLDLSRSVVYELVRRYRRRPQTSSLLPLKSGRHTHAHFLGPDREELLAVTIRQFYLTPQRPPLAALFQEVRLRFAQHRLKPPHYRTVRQRVQQLPSHLVLQRREGAKSARAKLGPVLASTLRADSPLDVVQIDHTPADVIVVDQENRLPIGRPCLSLAIDVASRMVMGFQVSLEPPSALAVSLVLTHAVLPKAEWLADRELPTVEWPACGLPDRIHVDNGKEFHSEAFARACQEHGIEVEYRPREQPHFGGHVERLIGTMMGAVHLLPGTTFSNPQEKASYDAEGRAVLTLPELERWLGLQIAGVYHLTVHSQLGRTPLEAWQEGMARRKLPVRIPKDPAAFFLDFLPGVTRRVERDGIHFHRIRYWSNVLSPWAGRREEPLLVKYDPRNLSRLYVRDAGGRYWTVPYANLGLPPIALWELLEVRREQRRRGDHDSSERDTFAHILQQRQIVKKATREAQQRRRGERMVQAPATPPSTAAPRESPPDTELKPFPVEEWGDD